MYVIKVWNTKSPNYDTNNFVEWNGTDSFRFESEDDALKRISLLVRDPDIQAITLNAPGKRLVIEWEPIPEEENLIT